MPSAGEEWSRGSWQEICGRKILKTEEFGKRQRAFAQSAKGMSWPSAMDRYANTINPFAARKKELAAKLVPFARGQQAKAAA